MIRLMLTRLFAERSVWLLPTAGFALTSGIGLMVLGGALHLYSIEDPEFGMLYGLFASIALVLLLVPMFALMSSAARLLARRRDERLSTLRLLGAGTGQLRRLVVAEAAVLAAVGILAGVILYLVLMPAVGLIPFAGARMGAEGLWVGPAVLAGACAGMLLFAVAASFLGLQRIRVTPLGIRTSRSTQQVWGGRAVVAGIAVVAVVLVYHSVPLQNQALIFAVILALLTIPLLAVQLIGPWVLRLVTAGQVKRAKSAERLIAARSVLESPQQMWRQVGGAAIAAFTGVIAGSGAALMQGIEQGHITAQEQAMIGDIQRGVMVTLAVTFLMTACSVALNQTAQIVDRRDLYAGMVRMGFTLDQLQRVRRLAVMRSLAAVLVIAVGAACIFVLPVLGYAVVVSPLAVATVVLALIGGAGLIRLGMLSTRPTLRSVAQLR